MRRLIFGVILLGAALLVVSQFLALYATHVSSQAAAVGSGTVGSAHGYGVGVIGLAAALLGCGVLTRGSRFVLALVGVLGVAALAIALGHDVSHAREAGITFVGGRYESAKDVVDVGLYVEIAGALVLMGAVLVGFVLAPGALAPGWRVTPAPRAEPGPRRRARSEIIERRERSEG